jgi:LmbE family N-acetylglucosaminyl deacetylase
MDLQPVKFTDESMPIVVPETIMVFAPHPDDELLSVGGTIMKYKELGSKITIVVATGGVGGYAKEEDKKDITSKRKHEMDLVADKLGVDFLKLGYDELDVTREYVSRFTNLLREYKPQLIFIPHYSDVHRTHRNLALILREAIYHTATGKAYGGAGKSFMPSAVYYYESPSCKFQYVQGSVFIGVDITKYWQKKVEIFKEAYLTQADMLDRVLSWAEKTAMLRGNEIGTDYAEAFIPATEYVPLKILII